MHPSLCLTHAADISLFLIVLLAFSCQRPSYCYAFATPAGKFTSKNTMTSPCDENQNASDQFRIGYMSDVEGHWDYFLESVQRSNVLDWEEANSDITHKDIQFKRLTLRGPNTHFIYGGDTVDKGPGDIRLVRSLVSLKKRYPERVHLLVGNRDLNKIRLPSELSESDMRRDVEDIPKPFWDRNAKSLKEYLEGVQQVQAATDVETADGSGSGGASSLEQLNSRQERLRYMLKHTLGCPDTFEFRREEVQTLTEIYGEYPPKLETHDVTPIGVFNKHGPSVEITDEQVVHSFLYEISEEEGSLRQYLNLSQIAAIVGNTIFVHGAIDSLTMKFVPSLDTKFELPTLPPPPFAAQYEATRTDGTIIEDVHEWVQSLNDYLKQGLEDFSHRPEWNDERTSRGGEGLLAIQNRPSMWGRSVVCNSYADGGVVSTADAEQKRKEAVRTAQEQSDPLAFEGIASNVMDPAPALWLLKHGIQRIVVGHKPTGDSPAVLSSKYTGVEVVAVDTSFSHRRDLHESENIGIKRFGDNRGEAIAMVEITGKDALSNWLETSGVLACGTEYSNEFPILSSSDSNKGKGDHYLGMKLSNGWWVKAAVPPNYHLCRGSGRSIEYDVRPMEDIINDLNLHSV